MVRPAQLNRNAAAVAAEQEKAFALKSAGATYRQIGEALGISTATAHRRVTAACTEHVVPELEHYRRITDEAYDRMIRSLAPAVIKGDVKAVDATRRIWADRRRMFGLDAPVVTEVNLSARVDIEIEATVTATAAAIVAVVELLELDAGFAADVERYALEVAGHSLNPAAGPPPEPPKRRLALMPGSGPVSPPPAPPDAPGPDLPGDGLTAAEQAELAALLGTMEDDDDAA